MQGCCLSNSYPGCCRDVWARKRFGRENLCPKFSRPNMSLPGKDCLGLWKFFLPVNRKAASRLTFVWGIGEEWGVEKSFFPIPQKLEPWFCTLCACVSLRGLDENGQKFYKNEESTWKACQTTIFHRQICKFVTILLPSLSCIPTLPNFFLVVALLFQEVRQSTCRSWSTLVFVVFRPIRTSLSNYYFNI